MRTRIKSVTIIDRKTYTVGETYNGLVLDRITNGSAYFPDSTHIEYNGFAKGDLVFQIINAPVDVQFEAVEEEQKPSHPYECCAPGCKAYADTGSAFCVKCTASVKEE